MEQGVVFHVTQIKSIATYTLNSLPMKLHVTGEYFQKEVCPPSFFYFLFIMILHLLIFIFAFPVLSIFF